MTKQELNDMLTNQGAEAVHDYYEDRITDIHISWIYALFIGLCWALG